MFFGIDGSACEVEFKEISRDVLLENFVLARICFNFDLTTRDKTADVKSVISDCVHKVSSSSSCFRLRNSKFILQGNKDKSILHMGEQFNNEDQEFGDLFKISNNKKKLVSSNYDMVTFDFLTNKSINASSSAPVVLIDSRKVMLIGTQMKGESILYIEKALPICKVSELLCKSIILSLQLAEFWQLKQLTDNRLIGTLSSYGTDSYLTEHCFNLIYPTNADEKILEEYRNQVHRTFLLPLNKPVVRKANRLSFKGDNKSGLLQNPHVGLRPSGADGEVSVVKGTYNYHHYMQDNFDDNKWGCAYRSLQSLVSWFRLQGYTDKKVPTHREIQQCLVDIGDKPSKFVGSTQWIGSTEVGFVLDNLFGITSKFIFVNSGDDLINKGRELSHHFQTQGTPIMIGGGVLAHTIIGVDWNSNTGDLNFLILDPHYTGGEDLAIIQKQGWCGWKKPDFWKSNAYYNLCLPQCPSCI